MRVSRMEMSAKGVIATLLAGSILACGARVGDGDATPSPQGSGVTPSKSADPLRDSEPGTGQGIDEREAPK